MALMVSVTTIVVGTISYRTTRDRLYAEVDRSLIDVDRRLDDRRFGVDTPLPDQGPLSGLVGQVVLRDGTVSQSTFPSPIELSELEQCGRDEPAQRVLDGRDAAGGVSRPNRSVFPEAPYRSADRSPRPIVCSSRCEFARCCWSCSSGRPQSRLGSGSLVASRRRCDVSRIAAEHVETTGRLDVEVAEHGHDEVGRLSLAFDRMLGALARSQEEQRRLAQDAGREIANAPHEPAHQSRHVAALSRPERQRPQRDSRRSPRRDRGAHRARRRDHRGRQWCVIRRVA